MSGLIEKNFPEKTTKYKSSDDPWITIGIRKKIKLRKRLFKEEGRSENWKRVKRITDLKIAEKRQEYYRRIKDRAADTNNIALYYRAVNLIKHK